MYINKQALNLNDLVVVVVASANLIFEIDSHAGMWADNRPSFSSITVANTSGPIAVHVNKDICPSGAISAQSLSLHDSNSK
jgi:hypothetical protein